MPYTDDYQAQLDKISSWSVANSRVADAALTATPQQANAVAAQSAAAPWTDPSTSVALGMNGNMPGDALSNQVHVASLNKKHGGFWSAIGSVVPGAQHILKLGIRGLATGAESLGQIGMGAVRDVASAAGDIGAGAISGALVGAAAGGFTPLDAFTVPAGLLIGAGSVAGGALIGGAVGTAAGGVAQAKGVKVEGGFVNPLGQSTAGQALGGLVGGHKVDIGTGFMAGGEVRKKQEEAARAAASINGHALTPGRMLASAVFSPGSHPYDYLSGIGDAITTWKLDPAIHVLGEVGAQVRQAKQIIPLADEAGPITKALTQQPGAKSVFDRMGLIKAASPSTDLEKAAQFINTDKAAIAFAERTGVPFVAGESGDSALDIWNASGRKLPPSIAHALQEAKTPQAAQEIIKGAVGERIVNEKAAFDSGSGITSTYRNFKAGSRLASFMPGHGIDLIDMDRSSVVRDHKLSTAVEKLDSWMKNAHFDPAQRDSIASKLLGAKSQAEASKIIEDTTDKHLYAKLKEMGAEDSRIKQLMQSKVTAAGELKSQIQKEIADNRQGFGVQVGKNAPVRIASGSQLNEMLSNIQHLPDPRLLQQMTNPSDSLRALYATKMWQGSVALGDRFMGTLWKPMNLIRPALGVRMVAMESAKMGAHGLESPLSHPLTLIKMIWNHDLRPGAATGGAFESIASGPLHDSAMSNMMDKTAFQHIVNAGDPAAASTWAARAAEAHVDPVLQYAAEHGLEAAKRELYGGALEHERQGMLASGSKIDVATKEASDAYVDSKIASHLTGLTADNPVLVKALADGHITTADGKLIHMDHLTSRQAEIEAAANKVADVAAERAVKSARSRAEAGTLTKGVEDVLAEADKPSKLEVAAQRAAAKAAKQAAEAEFIGPDGEVLAGKAKAAAKVELPKMSDAEVHALATKAGDAAAEKAVRTALKGAETGTVAAPAEKLSEAERVAKNAAEKAARVVAREDIPQGVKTVAEKAAPKLEQPLSSAERKALEQAVKSNPTPELEAQLRKDNDLVKQAMQQRRAGIEPTFQKTEALSAEHQATVEKARKAAYDAVSDALKGVKPPLSAADQIIADNARKAAYDAAIEAGQKHVLSSGKLINPDFEEHLQGLLDDANIKTPREFVGGKPIEAVDPDYNVKANKTVRWLYSTLISRPMNFLVRSPEFNQLQWKNLASVVSSMTEESATTLRESMLAVTAQIPEDTRTMLTNELNKLATNGTYGKLEIHDAVEAAKVHSLGQMADMTINMAHKTGWQDATRLMAPFSKHWQQELTQWAKIGVEHPDALRKVQMTVQGAEGSGFFYKDDQGKWAFNYPGADLVSNVVGAPFGMKASVSGLSALTSNMLPSFGPLVSIPATKILQNKPQFDSITNFISPYGDPTAKGALDAILPAWAKAMKTSLMDPQSDGDMGNYTMQMAKYLVSTGEYSMDTEEEVKKTLDEAGSRAKHLLWLQAFGKAVLPSSPTGVPMAEDGDGRTIVAKTMAADLAKLRSEDYSTSTAKFLKQYGENAFLFLQATTRSSNPSVGGLDTQTGYDFLRSNKGLIDALPNTYGFFAPQSDPNASYNYNAFQILQKSGAREKLTPLQQTHLANNQLGAMQYYAMKDSLGPKPSQEALTLLAKYKAVLALKFPGFTTSSVGLAQRATTPQVIDELTKAVTTMPKIADTSVGKSIKTYLNFRDEAIAIAKSRGNSFQQTASNADIRAMLRQVGSVLSEQTPGFGLVWDQVFDNEMRDIASEPSLTGASA